MSDLVALAGSYGTTGDPTKNVNVTNWPSSFLAAGEVVANGYLTIELNTSGSLFSPGGIITDSNEVQLQDANLTVIGGDISGEATWHWMGSIVQGNVPAYASAGGSCQATGRAEFYDSSNSLIAVLTVPINHGVSLSGVYRVKLIVEAAIPCAGGSSAWESFEAAATATIYWVQ